MGDNEQNRRRFWAKPQPFVAVDIEDEIATLEHLRLRTEAQATAAELSAAMQIDKRERQDPEGLERYLTLVRQLRQGGRITDAQYVCHVGSRLEGVCDDRYFAGAYEADLNAVQSAMTEIERREGLSDGQYWARSDEPEDYRHLTQAHEAILTDRLADVMREFGEEELAELLTTDRPRYDSLREAGRRSVFEADNHAVALRASVDAYEAEADRAAAAKAHLSACIMLGAAAEARLLLRCVQDPETASRARDALPVGIRPKKSDPFAWTLEQLIHVAAQARWIVALEGDDYVVFVERLAQQLRQTRNLIHPGRYVREWPHLVMDEGVYLDARAAYTALRLSEARADAGVATASPTASDPSA